MQLSGMFPAWKLAGIVTSALVISVAGIYMWRKKKLNYVKVGKISKLLFFPVKSLKAIEVDKGKCTKYGLEVNGFLDRSFMLVDDEGILISQRSSPKLALMTAQVDGKTLLITTPSGEKLEVEIKDAVNPGDKLIKCRIFTDFVELVDCGDEAAAFFQTHLNLSCARLVRFFPSCDRSYQGKHKFFINMNKVYKTGLQDLVNIHMLSKASVEDLKSKVTGQEISVLNFRPNIFVEECKPFAEDSWRFIKFPSGVELFNMILTSRCLLTTNDPKTGILSQKEPLATLRKYRIPADADLLDKLGATPCLGIGCAVLRQGDVSVGDEIFAVVGPQPKMKVM